MTRQFRWLPGLLTLCCSLALGTAPAFAEKTERTKNIILIAGKPSHPPGMHEFNAGVQLLDKCFQGVPGLNVQVALNGWPKDEGMFDDADAVVFYMDGGARHEVVQTAERMKLVEGLAQRGVGIGCMHYGVEILADQAGAEFKRWIGGHYEHMFSCNPIWEPRFTQFPDHPITRGVKPFAIKDEWYFNMRFISDISGNQPATIGATEFVPILVALPSDDVRDGPYVYPKGPYSHIQQAKGRGEAMMWTVTRADGGRGFGFTGGHFHANWGNDQFRKVVLNAVAWLAKVEIPANGLESHVTAADLEANLDPKPPKRK